MKTPYYIRLKSKAPFGFAGLWSQWVSPSEKPVYSCAIITGEPNELLSAIHNRAPIILVPEKRDEWLDPFNHDTKALLKLLEPYPAEEMEAFPVSTIVNDPNNNKPECIEPAVAP